MKNKGKMKRALILIIAMVSYLKAQNTEINFDGNIERKISLSKTHESLDIHTRITNTIFPLPNKCEETKKYSLYQNLKGKYDNNIETDPISVLIGINYVLNNIEMKNFDLNAQEKNLLLSYKNESLNYLSILLIKYLDENTKITLERLNRELFNDTKIRQLIDFIDKQANKDGFPSHYCWNECHRMCDGVYNICHLFCFHCCQTEGTSPLCK